MWGSLPFLIGNIFEVLLADMFLFESILYGSLPGYKCRQKRAVVSPFHYNWNRFRW